MDHVPPQHEHDADDRAGLRNGRSPLNRTLKRRLLAALALLGVFGFGALGVWQLERRVWKLNLIARVESRIHAAPAALPNPARWNDIRAPEFEYRRVRVPGVLAHDRETLVQALTERGAGYWVLTPLRTRSGTVLVNRGFVPEERRDPASRTGAQVVGPITITGLLRATEPGGGFLRTNDPAANRWYSRDVAAIMQARGISGGAPFFIDADAAPNPGGFPLGGLTVIRFSNNHLIYALTWFGLALLCALGVVLALRDPVRERR